MKTTKFFYQFIFLTTLLNIFCNIQICYSRPMTEIKCDTFGTLEEIVKQRSFYAKTIHLDRITPDYVTSMVPDGELQELKERMNDATENPSSLGLDFVKNVHVLRSFDTDKPPVNLSRIMEKLLETGSSSTQPNILRFYQDYIMVSNGSTLVIDLKEILKEKSPTDLGPVTFSMNDIAKDLPAGSVNFDEAHQTLTLLATKELKDKSINVEFTSLLLPTIVKLSIKFDCK